METMLSPYCSAVQFIVVPVVGSTVDCYLLRRQGMQGVVVCSVESGILIFAHAFEPSFGLGVGSTTADWDPMQLASTLFALYKANLNLDHDASDVASYSNNDADGSSPDALGPITVSHFVQVR
jgi:hypothetical protein